MGTITLRDFPDKILHFELPDVIDDEIIIAVYDDVTGLTITNCNSTAGFSTNVTNNQRDLSEFSLEIGKYDIEIHTQSEGILEQTIEIEDADTLLVFNLKEFEFELQRIDSENNQIVNTNTENLADTFVSTDDLIIKFQQLNGCNLESDGNSFDDIIWEVKGVTTNDGTPHFSLTENNSICEFTPNPINRPISGSRQPNGPIGYKVSATILGLKFEFELEQDEKDILRQEYLDYETNDIPTRNEVFFDTGRWNTGNYDYIVVLGGGGNQYLNIRNQMFQNWEDKGYQENEIEVSSSYRNPQRNRAVGSNTVNSRHTRGRAMDIRLLTSRTEQKWKDLRASGNEVTGIDGINAHCDRSGTFVDNNCAIADHIHIQW